MGILESWFGVKPKEPECEVYLIVRGKQRRLMGMAFDLNAANELNEELNLRCDRRNQSYVLSINGPKYTKRCWG